MTDLLQFTTNVRKSHRQTQCTLQLPCEDRVLFVWRDLDVCLSGQQHPKWGRPIRLVHPPFFCKLQSSSNPTKKKKSQALCAPYSNSSISVITHMFVGIYFHIISDTVTSPDIDPSYWIIVYTWKENMFRKYRVLWLLLLLSSSSNFSLLSFGWEIYYYYYYCTIWMSLVTDLFFLVLLLNQRWSPLLRL